MAIKEILSLIPKTGDLLSSVVQKSVIMFSKFGINITPLQSKFLLIIILGILIYALFSLITFAKKLLKWGLIVSAIFLAISVLISMFA